MNILLNFFIFFTILFFFGIKVIYGLNFDVDFGKESLSIFNKEDTLILNSSDNSDVGVFQLDNESDEYKNENKRIEIIQNGNSNTGFLISEQYGDFFIDSNDKISVYKSDNNSNCSGSGGIEYSFSGKVISEYWNDLIIDETKSYYCPGTLDYKITFNSEQIGEIYFEGNGQNIFNVTDSRGNTIAITESELFKDKNLSIDGLVSSDDISSTVDNEFGIDESTKLDFKGDMLYLKGKISKKLSEYTSELTGDTGNNLEGFSKKIHFYDYEGQEENNSSHLSNKGKILRLGDSDGNSGNGANFYKMQVTDHKLLYVKGGNIYIDSDIYNASNISQLVIVATRDSTNNKNGGNIYIDPDVTNIDATIIAEGSLLSFNGNKVLSTIGGNYDYSDKDLLKKQLLIYGSLSTKNTSGKNKAIYGTDHFIENGGEIDTGLYDLGNLRNFGIISSNQVESGLCNNANKIVSGNNYGTGALVYSFAGKKECYIDGSTQNGLRGTSKTSGVVIEYNPIQQINPHFIFK